MKIKIIKIENEKAYINLKKDISGDERFDFDFRRYFNDFKKKNIIKESCEYTHNVWIISRNTISNTRIEFSRLVVGDAQLLEDVKNFTLAKMKNGNPENAFHKQKVTHPLIRILNISDNFNEIYFKKVRKEIDEFTYSQMNVYYAVAIEFMEFCNFEEDNIYYKYFMKSKPVSQILVRKLKTISTYIVFDFCIDWVKNKGGGLLKKYYPLVIFWELSMTIPTRPIEIEHLENKCFKQECGYFFLNLRRYKDDNEKYIPDTIRINREFYDLLADYKEKVKEELAMDDLDNYNKSELLFSYQYYRHFTEKKSYKSDKINMERAQFQYLLKCFYKEIIKGKLKFEELEEIRLGDMRHLVICSLVKRGFNQYVISKLAGHEQHDSQTHYASHLEEFSTSYVNTYRDILHSMKDSPHSDFNEYRKEKEIITKSKKNLVMDYKDEKNIDTRRLKNGCYCTDPLFPQNCIKHCSDCKYIIYGINGDYENAKLKIQGIISETKNEAKENIDLLAFTIELLVKEFKKFGALDLHTYDSPYIKKFNDLNKKLVNLYYQKEIVLEMEGDNHGRETLEI
jgi:hypothetical protein